MHTLAAADTAKVEPQHREAKSPTRIVEDLHGVKNHFVMKIAAALRVGMADQSGKRRSGNAVIQHRLKAAFGAVAVFIPQIILRVILQGLSA